MEVEEGGNEEQKGNQESENPGEQETKSDTGSDVMPIQKEFMPGDEEMVEEEISPWVCFPGALNTSFTLYTLHFTCVLFTKSEKRTYYGLSRLLESIC